MTKTHVPLGNLRAVVIIIVVAFHSFLPYLASQPTHPFPFDAAPYRWVAFPIIDRERWFGFDLFCAWQDVSLMSLMFFLAGLLTPASLQRKGSLLYLSERWWRIGLPFLVAAGILSPAAYYASYRATAADTSVAAFWQHWLALPMWPAGPQWFLWQLFLLAAIAAALHALAPQWLMALRRIAEICADQPLGMFVIITAASAVAYVPLAMAFTPWDWTYLGPFAFQLSRPLHYLVYFFTGFALGSYGWDRGVLDSHGPLARHWRSWLAAAVLSMSLWGGLTSLTYPDWNASPVAYRLAAALAFPLACATGVLCLLAMSLQLMRSRETVLDSLSSNAYRIYLVHYLFVVWLQYALLSVELNAVTKAAIVLACALTLSWGASAGVMKLVDRHAGSARKAGMAQQPR